MKITKCDLCGNIESKRYSVLNIDYDSHTSHDFSGTDAFDVCAECSTVITKLIKSSMQKEAESYIMRNIDKSMYDSYNIRFKEFK